MNYTDLEIAKKMVSKADNAKQRGLEFSLTFQDMKRLMKRKTCYYSGVVMTKTSNKDGHKRTLDRINSKLGYTKENTVACTSAVNTLKNRFLEELGIDLKLIKRLIKEVEDAQRL